MSVDIHPTAVVSPSAELGDGVKIGPYAVIGDGVVIGEGCLIEAHVTIGPNTRLGRDNHIYPQASVGSDPQDLLYQGEETSLVIGDNNIIREFVTVNRGTPRGGGVTRLGNHCLLMAYSHIGHDCQVGDHVILVNMGNLGGHCVLEDWVIISGAVVVHQFCRIGTHAFIGGMSAVVKDVPPFVIAEERRTKLRGLNIVGLKRRGFSEETLASLKEAYRMLFRSKDNVFAVRVDLTEEKLGHVPEVKYLIDFIRSSKRGICR